MVSSEGAFVNSETMMHMAKFAAMDQIAPCIPSAWGKVTRVR